MHGSLCFYCREESASQIDHIIPYSWDGDNSIENLVPSCAWCNVVASNKLFENVWQKKEYILSKRKRKIKRSICTECLLPFVYKEHSNSPFLCPECYDIEYSKNEKSRSGWKTWLKTMEDAGFLIQAHRNTGIIIRTLRSKINKKQHIFILACEIDKYVSNLENQD